MLGKPTGISSRLVLLYGSSGDTRKQKNTYIWGGEEIVQSFVLTDDSVWPEMASPYTGNNDY